MIGTEGRGRTVLITVAVCGMVALAWGWAAWTQFHWQFKYTSEVTDIAELLGQYTRGRLETGRWPEPGQLYGTFFRLRSSARTTRKRIDTCRVGPDGPWLQFELEDDGRISAHVSWEECATVASSPGR